MKQAIIIRKDLKMGPGKVAAQASHASLEAYKKASDKQREEWESEGQKKVVLKIGSEKEIISLFERAKLKKLPSALIRDAGHTQISSGTITALGIGPYDDDVIDFITGDLKLY